MVGIYCIRFDDKFYVGQSINIENRWYRHLNDLVHEKHGNMKLQHAWNKYGQNNFHFEIIELCLREELTRKEQFWMNALDAYLNGYNNSLAADSMTRGISLSKEHKLKLSKAGKGRFPSEESKAKMRESWKNRKPVSDECKLKMSEAHKGKKFSCETIKKMSQSHVGITHSDEIRCKISQNCKGKSKSSKGKKHVYSMTDEHKRKIIETKQIKKSQKLTEQVTNNNKIAIKEIQND